ncbi:MAG: hypothetical protein K0R52_551 [Alphaproteobacteria bacterium]|nr:hypothetical protein [Alphaproteobacteria bacterium]
MKDIGNINHTCSREAVALDLLKIILENHPSTDFFKLDTHKKILYIIQIYQKCLTATIQGIPAIEQIPDIKTFT